MKLKRLLFCCFKSEIDDETIHKDDITQCNAAEYVNAEEDSLNQTNAVEENSVVIECILEEENEIAVEDKEDSIAENNNQEVLNLIVPLTDNHENLNGMKDIENVNKELAVSNVVDHVHHDNGEGNIILVVEDKEDPIKDDNRHVPLLDNQENSIDVNDFETNKLEVSNVIKHDVQEKECAIDEENVDKEDIEQHHKKEDPIAVDDGKQTKSSEHLLQYVVEDCDCDEEEESRSLTTKNIVHYDQEEKDISVVEEGAIGHGDEEETSFAIKTLFINQMNVDKNDKKSVGIEGNETEDSTAVDDDKQTKSSEHLLQHVHVVEDCDCDEEEESRSLTTKNIVHYDQEEKDISVVEEGAIGNGDEEETSFAIKILFINQMNVDENDKKSVGIEGNEKEDSIVVDDSKEKVKAQQIAKNVVTVTRRRNLDHLQLNINSYTMT